MKLHHGLVSYFSQGPRKAQSIQHDLHLNLNQKMPCGWMDWPGGFFIAFLLVFNSHLCWSGSANLHQHQCSWTIVNPLWKILKMQHFSPMDMNGSSLVKDNKDSWSPSKKAKVADEWQGRTGRRGADHAKTKATMTSHQLRDLQTCSQKCAWRTQWTWTSFFFEGSFFPKDKT